MEPLIWSKGGQQLRAKIAQDTSWKSVGKRSEKQLPNWRKKQTHTHAHKASHSYFCINSLFPFFFIISIIKIGWIREEKLGFWAGGKPGSKGSKKEANQRIEHVTVSKQIPGVEVAILQSCWWLGIALNLVGPIHLERSRRRLIKKKIKPDTLCFYHTSNGHQACYTFLSRGGWLINSLNLYVILKVNYV